MSSQFGPFLLESTPNQKMPGDPIDGTLCVLCENLYTLDKPELFDEFLKHLLVVHKLVVADVRLIADIPKYVQKKILLKIAYFICL